VRQFGALKARPGLEGAELQESRPFGRL